MSIYPEFTGLTIRAIHKLLQVLALQVPYEPSLKDLKAAIQISDDRSLKKYIQILHQSGLIRNLFYENPGIKVLLKPEKIYLDNSSLMAALSQMREMDRGTAREVYFLSMTSTFYKPTLSKVGDFKIDDYIFEIGGKNKSQKQMSGEKNAFLALDELEVGHSNVIPLWLFGFLY